MVTDPRLQIGARIRNVASRTDYLVRARFAWKRGEVLVQRIDPSKPSAVWKTKVLSFRNVQRNFVAVDETGAVLL